MPDVYQVPNHGQISTIPMLEETPISAPIRHNKVMVENGFKVKEISPGIVVKAKAQKTISDIIPAPKPRQYVRHASIIRCTWCGNRTNGDTIHPQCAEIRDRIAARKVEF